MLFWNYSINIQQQQQQQAIAEHGMWSEHILIEFDVYESAFVEK